MPKFYKLTLCCLLTACTVGPDYQSPQLYSDSVIKSELGLKKDYQVPTNWYMQFCDQQLNDLISIGLNNSTDIAIAVSRLQQARAELDITRTAFLPQVNVDGGYKFQKNSKNIGVAIDTEYYNAGFDASWELDIWGKGRRQTEAAQAAMLAQKYTLDNIRTAVIAELASNYINLKMAVEKLRLARENIALQRDIFATVNAKYQSGLADSIAYNQAKYLLSTTEASIPALESEIEQYKNAVSVVAGILPSQLPFDPNKRSIVFTRTYKFDTAMVYNLPASVVRRRPDVASAERNLASQNALIGVAVANLYPDVSVTALWGMASKKGSNLFGANSQSYGYEPTFSLPLLDWNRLQNEIEKQKFAKDEAFATYKNTVLTAISELKNSMISVQNELNTNRSLARALSEMQSVVQSSTSRYENGLLDFSDLLQAEQNRINAQNSYIESQAQIFKNLISYYKASGGGYLK